jgi:hypothetical protein
MLLATQGSSVSKNAKASHLRTVDVLLLVLLEILQLRMQVAMRSRLRRLQLLSRLLLLQQLNGRLHPELQETLHGSKCELPVASQTPKLIRN